MFELIKQLSLAVVLLPLAGCLIAGLLGKRVGVRGAHAFTIACMIVSFACAAMIFKLVVLEGNYFDGSIYTWAHSGTFHFDIGFLIDRLTAIMMLIVTFVSLVVHIYSIGYMRGDSGNQRFFSYVSGFTFAMLMLVSANNFLQLFFGWEGVGLVSYLLIGFWFHKESAATGSLKAFLVNRMGDFGFLLGIAAIMDYFGSLSYSTVFAKATQLSATTITIIPGHPWLIITVICILLFIGAMGKSAQVPLHVWLPESMEGPTPISALIHAATMVTAGVFMVARMSPLFELSSAALSMVMIVGATGALFLGLLAFVEFDIKRVIAYSTMSQLGYMMAANGASAFNAAIFHLMTHACFKALLFLAAGSVIIAMHHEQDLRKMGNLKKYLPVTYITFLIGALALSAVPPTSGFFSKDAIIEAVHHSTIVGAEYSYIVLLIGAFVTAFYIFRAFFMAFHTEEKMDDEVRAHLKEQWIMLFPLILLAIPSLLLGWFVVEPMLFASPGFLGGSFTVLSQYNVLLILQSEFHGAWSLVLESVKTLPFWFSITGIVCAWLMVMVVPQVASWFRRTFSRIYRALLLQYGFDLLNEWVFVRGGRAMSEFFFKTGDLKVIDGGMVDGSGRGIAHLSTFVRKLQSGYLYFYVFVMIVALLALLIWLVF
ncbi:MAG: NADH-quinone oxidoreductase subunit L [Gammaproteobacteria bacterium RIFCSPLOWO2_02_FULL_42_14]|nr:MAG: NADH-quinone oxidoreductase subunit L [Gammaproteobacteria bacterium RIFCSPHIGHO2_02_FULL_42_43]OGT52969.1 MAG: NADH-quinone oxidoreductase subunit L [Gammaproteobacteria bacterium RIFCSPHIGHO2_12_FULL_41_25]OGT61257.1 MAG: NADH-quinone oxidoreductase subunit L [Gammaproteobacteria bacterium RIFCSPLOWO2_02_FULL_42_14]OGT87186.1 MAG: NADH-quinone oxidoreductase subunit L [Gammaproteobacteria bacterium RIFCSPLOWO2_12_FULL_42_18]